jgi:hypothetical protein
MRFLVTVIPKELFTTNIRGIPTEICMSVDEFDFDKHDYTKTNIFIVQHEMYANMLAEIIAAKVPDCEVNVSEVKTIYQAETPKVGKKVVSERGALPA